MERENIVQKKSFDFAIKIVDLYKYLINDKKEFVLSKQILKSGTSIGANIEEAIGGQSKNDFISKISIAYKEARETLYWLKLLKETNYITQSNFKELSDNIEELLKILGKIQVTTKTTK